MEMGKGKVDRLKFLMMIGLILFFCWIHPYVCLANRVEQEMKQSEDSGQFLYEGPIVLSSEEMEEPPEYLEQYGKQYQRVSMELKETYLPGTLTYENALQSYELEGWQEAPETIQITLQDDATGQSFVREIPRKDIIERELRWDGDFSFPVTVYGYDADVFYLGDHEIPAGDDLTMYGDLLLEYLELPSDCYQVDRIEWIGEVYEQEGILCQDAMAYGEKLVRLVDVIYGGQIRTPDLPAKQYRAVYEEIPVERIEETETIRESESEEAAFSQPVQPDPFFHRLKKWMKEHLTVVVFSGLFLLGFGGWILLLYLSGRKKKEEAGD